MDGFFARSSDVPIIPANVSTNESRVMTIAWITLVILALMQVLSYTDRMIITLLFTPIQRDLHLSDFQISTLSGASFSIAYALCGVPMGWMADRLQRRLVAGGGVMFWSFATSLCGLTSSYWSLALARLGVGAGEAALAPSAYSMLADMFPRRRLAMVLGLFSTGSALGSSLAFLVGGALIGSLTAIGTLHVPVLGDLKPWQVTFLIVGLTGVPFSLLFLLIPEPSRGSAAKSAAQLLQGPGIFEFLLRNRRYIICHFLGFSMTVVTSTAMFAWTPTLLQRQMGLDVATVGRFLGVASLTGPIGFIFGGWVTDRWFSRGTTDAHLRYFVFASIISGVIGTLMFAFVHNVWVFVPIWSAVHLLQPFTGQAAGHLQIVTPPHLRGRISALFLLTYMLIGLSLGPITVGFATDFVFHDQQKLHLSLALVYGIGQAIAAVLLFLGLAPARRAVADAFARERLQVVER
jgi:MFS family permease